MLAVNSHSKGNRQAKASSGGSYVWVAEPAAPAGAPAVASERYVALLNHGAEQQAVSATFKELGLPAGVSKCEVTDLWTGEPAPPISDGVSLPHFTCPSC